MLSLNRFGKGFTLIEVAVSLIILGLVLGGLYKGINAQVDSRFQLKERYLAQAVSWNRLLGQYQIVQKWIPPGQRLGEKKGETDFHSRDWYWELDVRETLGEDFYRYEVKTYSLPDRSGNSDGSLVVYLVAE